MTDNHKEIYPAVTNLLDVTLEQIKQNNFSHESLWGTFEKYFTNLKVQQADRCVDGRSLIKNLHEYSQKLDKKNYFGRQFPGGTLGVLDITRKTLGLDENSGRSLVLATYNANKLKIGGHIDNHDTENVQSLLKRRKGCGNQKVVSEKMVSVLDGLNVTSEVADDRINWIAKYGDLYPLNGSHTESVAVINFVNSKTVNVFDAVEEKKAMFNMDIMQAHFIAGLIFEKAKKQNLAIPYLTKERFQLEFTKNMIADYLQTLSALGYKGKIFLKTI